MEWPFTIYMHVRKLCQTSLSLSLSGGDNSTCIFSSNYPLYTSGFREMFRPVDSLIDSCEDLDQSWTYLVGLMSLSFIGFVVSLIAIFSGCITLCAEEKYNPQDRTEVWLLLWKSLTGNLLLTCIINFYSHILCLRSLNWLLKFYTAHFIISVRLLLHWYDYNKH